jgi:Nitroreductase
MKNEALEVLKSRRAIRKFKSEQISDEELNAVLEAGTYAPTGKGTQSPVIVAVQSPEMREKVVKLNAKVMGSPDADPYYGAPTILLVFFGDRAYDEEIGILDCGAVTTNLLNAAYACGLGSCWINRPKQMFMLEEGKKLLKEWGLPDNLRGVASIALGYADCETPSAPPRKKDYIYKI